MKRILLSLAAVAALASCVKENFTEPVQNAGKYTIKAAAQTSKTTLAGTSVEWEVEDEIAVLLTGDNAFVSAKFGVAEGSLSGSSADFVGDLILGDAKFVDFESAYAVYPSSALNSETGKFSHTLAADQTAGIASGDLLSSASVSLENLVKGEAQAKFNNALTLLQVVVPEGVQKVEFTADMYSSLVGTAEFTLDADGKLEVSKPSTSRKVTLEVAEGLEAKTYPVLVYPGKVKELTLHMVGLDGAEYTNTVKDLEFVAGEYRTINLCNIFGIYSEDTLYATPAGGNVLVPVVSAVDHEFTVTTDVSWITYVETKGFHGTEIVLNVEANTTGAAREASVTVKWGEDAKDSRTYKVSQEALYDHFLNDADGNPIKWEESFGLYSSESDAKNETNAVVTYKNVFTIELSDDFSKGMYKVNGMLVENNSYTGKAGATYYANYNDGQLIVLKNDKGYAFNDKEVAFTYNEAEKTFTAAPIKFGYKFDNADMRNGGYIGGYKAVVKVEEPVGPSEPEDDPIAGTWDVTCNYGAGAWGPAAATTGTMLITKSSGTYTIEEFLGTSVSWELTQDGNTFTVNAVSEATGPGKLVLTYDESTMTLKSPAGTSYTDWTSFNMSDIVATKQGGAPETPEVPEEPVAPAVTAADLVGTWHSSFMAGGPYENDNMTIELTDNESKGQLKVKMFAYSTYSLVCYANLSSDGTTLTVLSNGVDFSGMGTFSKDMVMSVSVEEGQLKIVYAEQAMTSYMMPVGDLVATKPYEGGAEEPEEPVAPVVAAADLVGTWHSSFMAGGPYENDNMTIELTDNESKGQLKVKMFAYSTYSLVCYANLSSDGTTLTVLSNGVDFSGMGTFSKDMVMSVSVEEGQLKIVYAEQAMTSYMMPVGDLVATKPYVGGDAEPEPADPWATAASFTNDGTGYGAFMKELKVYADETNMYVRLTVEKQAAYSVEEPQAANYLDMVLANGEGETQLWWGWTTPATKSYKMEHKGDLTEGKLTKMRWYHSPETEGDRVYVDYTTEEVDGNYVYGFTYPREWVNKYASSTGKIYVSFMLWNGWDEYWAIPQTGNSMLEVVLP